MLKFGTVTELDATKALVKVKFIELDDVESNWLRVLQQKTVNDQFYSMPDINEQVVCLLEGNLNNGVVLGSVYSDSTPPPVDSENIYHKKFSDGTEISFDREKSSVSFKAAGALDVEIESDASITIKGNNTIKIKGDSNISVDGDCSVDIKGSGSVNSIGDLDIATLGACNISAGTSTSIASPMVDIGMVPALGIVHAGAPCPLLGTHIAGASVTCKVSL